jgi:glyoxylase-like metal-dependent hydrolase (beta-lactamase superfamily II)
MEIVAEDKDVKVGKLSLGPYGTNTYVLICKETNDSVIVDAPGDTVKMMEALKGTNPKYILITHNHMDHTGALKQLKSNLGVPVASHVSDTGSLPIKPEILLKDNDEVIFGKIKLTVLHTPGHTPGSICFYHNKILISGDTIFPGGPGKTWSPASFMQIVSSITNKIFKLPDGTILLPGHGGSTVVEKEKEEYKIFTQKSHDPDLCGDVIWLKS